MLKTIAAAREGEEKFIRQSRRLRIEEWREWMQETNLKWQVFLGHLQGDECNIAPLRARAASQHGVDLLERVWARLHKANEQSRVGDLEYERRFLASLEGGSIYSGEPRQEAMYRYHLAIWARKEAERMEMTDPGRADLLRWVHDGALRIEWVFNERELLIIESLLKESGEIDPEAHALSEDEAMRLITGTH